MKKISRSLISGLIILCLSSGIYAQSSDQELNQAELIKQLIGKWKVDLKNDTVGYWEVIPSDKGYLINGKWQAIGETYSSVQGIMGFTWKNRQINMYGLWNNGYISRDLGKFITKDKLVLERFNATHTNKSAIWELTIQSPDKLNSIWKVKGAAEDWSDATVAEWIFERVKE